MVEAADDPLAAVDEITAALPQGPTGFLPPELPRPHAHRRPRVRARPRPHARRAQGHLPKSNDPGCPAGLRARARDRRRAADRPARSEGGGRGLRRDRHALRALQLHARLRARVHADLRRGARPRSRSARSSARTRGPDCAQGAFHDYWFSVGGFDDTQAPTDPETDPKQLCGAQEPEYVRQCWYRAFVDNRPPGAIDALRRRRQLCQALEGLQREGCITAATVIGPADPHSQFSLCFGFTGEEALACVRGIEAPEPARRVERAVRRRASTAAARFPRRCGSAATAGWARPRRAHRRGVRDGRLPAPPEGAVRAKACVEGARTMDEPLVTFS